VLLTVSYTPSVANVLCLVFLNGADPVAQPGLPSAQLNHCRQLTSRLEGIVHELRNAYSTVPMDELAWLLKKETSEDSNAEDAAAMGAELVALELQQLLSALPTPSVVVSGLHYQQDHLQHQLVSPPSTPQLSLHAATMALAMRGKFRKPMTTAHLGLSSHLVTPKTERNSPWLGHDNLGKRRTGVGEFGPVTAALHPGAAIPRYD
jgi:hypothetical protein